MADLGKVGIVAKGTWNNSSTYEALDVVAYNGGTYIAKQNVPANTLPTNTTYWQVGLANTYASVLCNDITALSDLITLITTPNIVGYGLIGTLEDTSLKTLIGQPFAQNYICCFIRLIGSKSDALAFELTAIRENNAQYAMAKKYVWFNGNSRLENQSAWETIARQV